MASVTTLYETIDIERLNALIALDEFTKDERDQLEKYKKKYMPRVGAVKVDYQLKGLQMGSDMPSSPYPFNH